MRNLLVMRTAEDVERGLKLASIAGVIGGGILTLTALAASMSSGVSLETGFMMFSGSLMYGLAYGITQGSRSSAMALLTLYASTLMAFASGADVTRPATLLTALIASVLVFGLVRGVQATFACRRMEREIAAWQQPLPAPLDPRLLD